MLIGLETNSNPKLIRKNDIFVGCRGTDYFLWEDYDENKMKHFKEKENIILE